LRLCGLALASLRVVRYVNRFLLVFVLGACGSDVAKPDTEPLRVCSQGWQRVTRLEQTRIFGELQSLQAFQGRVFANRHGALLQIPATGEPSTAENVLPEDAGTIGPIQVTEDRILAATFGADTQIDVTTFDLSGAAVSSFTTGVSYYQIPLGLGAFGAPNELWFVATELADGGDMNAVYRVNALAGLVTQVYAGEAVKEPYWPDVEGFGLTQESFCYWGYWDWAECVDRQSGTMTRIVPDTNGSNDILAVSRNGMLLFESSEFRDEIFHRQLFEVPISAPTETHRLGVPDVELDYTQAFADDVSPSRGWFALANERLEDGAIHDTVWYVAQGQKPQRLACDPEVGRSTSSGVVTPAGLFLSTSRVTDGRMVDLVFIPRPESAPADSI